MASLSTVPYDVLEQIFRYLSNASLASISRTNKSFHNTVELALYEHIRMTMITEPKHPGLRRLGSTVVQYPPVHLLLRSVWNRPKLADYIKHVEFQCKSGIDHSDPVVCNPIPEPVLTEQESKSLFDYLHRDFFRQKGVTNKVKKDWIRSLTKSGPPNDAHVAFLISQLSNIKTISLPDKLWDDSKFMGRMFRRALYKQTPKEADERRRGPPSSDEHKLSTFQYLESIYAVSDFMGEQDLFKQNSGDVEAFFYLPSLKELSVSWDNKYATEQGAVDLVQRRIPLSWPTERPLPTNITSLDVSVLKEESLAEVLSLAPTLHTFKWTYWYDNLPRRFRNSRVLDCETLLKALSHVRDTIENLSINAYYRESFRYPMNFKLVNGILKLSDYKKIRKLEAPLMLLLGPYSENQVTFAHVLPSNVEHVIINTNGFRETASWRWQPEALSVQLEIWLRDWKAITSHLKIVEIRWYSAWGPDGLSHLESLLVKTGLRYIIHIDLVERDDRQWWGGEWKNDKEIKIDHHRVTSWIIGAKYYELSNNRTFDDLHTDLLAAKDAEELMQKLNLDGKEDLN